MRLATICHTLRDGLNSSRYFIRLRPNAELAEALKQAINVGVNRHAAALRRRAYAHPHARRRSAAVCPSRTTCSTSPRYFLLGAGGGGGGGGGLWYVGPGLMLPPFESRAGNRGAGDGSGGRAFELIPVPLDVWQIPRDRCPSRRRVCPPYRPVQEGPLHESRTAAS